MLTRREKYALIIAVIIALIFTTGSLLSPKEEFNQFLRDWELVYLFVVVGPLGFYIASDPERMKNG